MDIRCSFRSCIDFPKYICLCSEQNICYCLKHWEAHMENNPSGIHTTKNLQINISKNEKEGIKEKLKEEIYKTRKGINQCIQKCSNIIKELILFQNLLLSNARSYISKCRRILAQATLNDKIAYLVIKPKDPIFEINLKLVQSELHNMYVPKHYSALNLNESINSLLDFFKTKDSVEKFILLKHDSTENLLLSAKECENSIFYYSIDDNSQQEIQLNLEYPLANQSAACWIDKNTVFIQNDIQKNSGNAYIYNHTENSILKVPSTIKRTGAQPIVYNEKVYFFGGISNKNILSTCDYYDIKDMIWKNFSELPEPSSCTSTLVLGRNIIISTHRCKVFEYDSEDNSYNLTKSISFTGGHFIVKCNDNMYLIGKKCYFCPIFLVKEWKMYNTYSGPALKCGGSRPIVRGNKVYFFANDNNAYQLELISLSFTKLT